MVSRRYTGLHAPRIECGKPVARAQVVHHDMPLDAGYTVSMAYPTSALLRWATMTLSPGAPRPQVNSW